MEDELNRVLYYGPDEGTMPIPMGNDTQIIPRGLGVYRSGRVWVNAQEERRSRYEQSQRPSDSKVLGWALAMLGVALLITGSWFYVLLFL